MWNEVDKRQCIIDIMDENINLKTDVIKVVWLDDDDAIEELDDIEIVSLRDMVKDDSVKFFHKVVDKSKYI